MIFTYRTIQNGGKIIGGALASPPPRSPGSAVPGRVLSYLTCMSPYHIVRKHLFNQINLHGKNSGGVCGADLKTTLHYTYGKINPSCATVRDIEFVKRNVHKVRQEIEMVHLFKHLSFICPFTCLSGYNSDTITELERKCRRLQTQVFQMEVQWNIPPPPFIRRPRRPKRKNHCVILLF